MIHLNSMELDVTDASILDTKETVHVVMVPDKTLGLVFIGDMQIYLGETVFKQNQDSGEFEFYCEGRLK